MNSEDVLVLLVLAIGSAIMIAMAFASHSQTSTVNARVWFSYSKPSLPNVEPGKNRLGNCIVPCWNASMTSRWLEF